MAMTLPKPEGIKVEVRPAAIAQAAADPEIVDKYEACVGEWADLTTKLLDEEPEPATDDDDDIGPRTELAWWRKRATKLNSICDDLRGEDCQQIMLVLHVCKSRKYKVWRAKNNAITDALNEAKDNVKYLSTLDKYIEPLYSASPPEVIESLSGLLNYLRMMHAIAWYYATPERMTSLFAKITEQMIVNCRGWVTKEGVLWEQDTASLLSRLQTCHSLFQHYRSQYEATRDKLHENPQAKQFELSESVIFSKSNLFRRRVEKLIDLFTTVDQFTTLSNHNLEGMEGLMANFFTMVGEFKRKPYDLFDFQANQFDRDYLEFLPLLQQLWPALRSPLQLQLPLEPQPLQPQPSQQLLYELAWQVAAQAPLETSAAAAAAATVAAAAAAAVAADRGARKALPIRWLRGGGTPGSLAIRRATARDIAGLVKLEASRQHPALLAASEGTIRQRIEAHPMGQFVAVSPDGQVVGAAYTQRVALQDSLLATTRERELSLHTPHGRVVQLLGVVQMPAANVSDQLRRYVLHCSGLDATVDEVCVVARCRSFDPSVHGASPAAYQAHVDACTDPELLLHTSAGACIFGLVAGYRVADTANLGYGVIVTYGLSSASAGRHLASTLVRSAAEVRRELTFARSPPGSERLPFEQVEEEQPPGWPRHLQSRGQQHLVASSARWPGSAFTSFAFLPAGGDAVGQIPSQRWGVADSPVPAGRFGAFLSHAERFAAAFFGVSAAETSATDPQQRLLLEHGYAALHSTHERRESLRAADVGVFLGIMNADFASIYVESDSVYAATGGTISIAAGRLSFVVGTQGPVASYDTACSSGLVASHAAFGAARAGECASSLVLAVSLMLSPQVRNPHPLLPL